MEADLARHLDHESKQLKYKELGEQGYHPILLRAIYFYGTLIIGGLMVAGLGLFVGFVIPFSSLFWPKVSMVLYAVVFGMSVYAAVKKESPLDKFVFRRY